MQSEEIEKRLLANLPSILHTLYPAGKVTRGEFVVGDIGGSPGDSLKIRLKDGVWSDFADGGSGKIFKLFSARHGGDFAKGMAEIKHILKIPYSPIENKYKRPKKDWLDDIEWESPPMRYLVGKRKIPRSLLNACQVKTNDHEYIFTGSDENGKMCYAQYTSRTKDGGKEIRFSPLKAKLPLWGMHTMSELNTTNSVIITEGVIDAMTFRLANMFAVSIPSGVTNTDWIKHSWNWLEQFSTIYLCFDYDTAGQNEVRTIAGRLGIHRCKRVILPKKDANQLMLDNPSNWIQLLKIGIQEALDISPPKRVTAREVKGLVSQFIEDGPTMDKGTLLLGWQFPDTGHKKGLNFRFRPGEQTIVGGYTGSGKSTFVFQHAAYCMFILGETVAIAALEEPVEKVISVIMAQALGYYPIPNTPAFNRAYEVIQDKLIIFNQLGRADLEEVLEFFEYATKRDGAVYCILDSLMKTNIDIDGEKSRVNDAITTIIDSTVKTNSHYIIVAHCTKGNDEKWEEMPSIDKVKGIQEITANAHNVIMVWRNKPKMGTIDNLISNHKYSEIEEVQAKRGDTILKVTKNRNGQHLGQIHTWFDVDSYRFRPAFDKSIDTPYINEEDDSAHNSSGQVPV